MRYLNSKRLSDLPKLVCGRTGITTQIGLLFPLYCSSMCFWQWFKKMTLWIRISGFRSWQGTVYGDQVVVGVKGRAWGFLKTLEKNITKAVPCFVQGLASRASWQFPTYLLTVCSVPITPSDQTPLGKCESCILRRVWVLVWGTWCALCPLYPGPLSKTLAHTAQDFTFDFSEKKKILEKF